MKEQDRPLRVIALSGIAVLVIIAVAAFVWSGVVASFFPSAQEERLSGVLIDAAFPALYGAILAAIFLLLGRWRSGVWRTGWRTAAVAVIVLAILGGPVLSAVRYVLIVGT